MVAGRYLWCEDKPGQSWRHTAPADVTGGGWCYGRMVEMFRLQKSDVKRKAVSRLTIEDEYRGFSGYAGALRKVVRESKRGY